MPVRDAAPTLRACLESIAAQTFTDYELVAVDDGSRDDSARILTAAADRDRRIRVLRQPATGLVAALNAGLAACRFDLVARMDADDRMHPERLRLQRDAMVADPGLAVLGSRVALLPGAATARGLVEYLRWQNGCVTPEAIANDLYVESPFAHPSVMFRAPVVAAAGGYRDGPFPEDYDLWLRLAQRGARMAKRPEVLLEWRDLPGRLSRTDPRCAREAFDRLRAHYLARDPRVRAAREGVCFWGAGRRTRRRVAHLLREGVRPRIWIDVDPRKIGNVIEGARVVAPAGLRALERPFVLSYVANHGARDDIARALTRQGLEAGRDFLSVG